MYIDIHCHLDHPTFRPRFVDIIKECKEKNVVICTAATDLASCQKAVAFAKKFNNVRCFLGVYPRYSYDENMKDVMTDSDVEKCFEYIEKNKDVLTGIGEVGLDFSQHFDKVKQEQDFNKQIQFASEWKKPIVVHSRKAEERAIELIEASKLKQVVMHCFSGSKKLLKRGIDQGFYFSIPTAVVRAQQFQMLVEQVPIEQLFCETDSPYMSPFPDQPNQPSFVIESYKKIAEIKKLEITEVEKQIEKNFKRITG